MQPDTLPPTATPPPDIGRQSKRRTERASNVAVERKSWYYSLLYAEMAERRRAEESLSKKNDLLDALSKAQLRYLSNVDLPVVLKELTDRLLEITGSEYALIVEVPAEEEDAGSGKTLAFSSRQQPTDTDLVDLVERAHGVNEAGIPVISDRWAHSGSTQPPSDGYCGIDAFLGLPFYTDQAVSGAICVANRPNGYDKELIDFLQPIVSACAQLIVAEKNRQQRKQAETALVNERASLAQRVVDHTAKLRITNAELKRAIRARDEFLAVMNHELRTPLHTVLALTEVLQDQAYGPLNDKQIQTLQTVEESGHHLLSLITDILDIVKINVGKIELDVTSTDVKAVCTSSLRLVSALAHKKEIAVSMTIDPEVTSMDVDGRRLKHMLVNLLSNAIKFTEDGGEVGLEVSADNEDNTVLFSVWDTGIGIAEAEMGKLFQPFVQVDSSYSRQYAGTGLGLALVARMADLHGGNVSVQSTPGKGSRFTIVIPRYRAEKGAGSAADTTLGSEGFVPDSDPSSALYPARPIPDLLQRTDLHQIGQTERANPYSPQYVVLLAEENEDTVEAISAYLHHQDCRLIVARNGREAVDKARTEQPDLILMDIQMPHMDGLEATRMIRAEPHLKDIPIIATTALAMPGDRSRFLDAGMNDYISKPFSLRALKETIAGQLHQDYANLLPTSVSANGEADTELFSTAGQQVAMKAGRG